MKITSIVIILLFTFSIYSQSTTSNEYAFHSGTINGKTENIKISKKDLNNLIVGVKDVKHSVLGFKIKVRNYSSYKLNGNKLDNKVISMIKKTKKNKVIIVYDIVFKKGKTYNGLVKQVSFVIE